MWIWAGACLEAYTPMYDYVPTPTRYYWKFIFLFKILIFISMNYIFCFFKIIMFWIFLFFFLPPLLSRGDRLERGVWHTRLRLVHREGGEARQQQQQPQPPHAPATAAMSWPCLPFFFFNFLKKYNILFKNFKICIIPLIHLFIYDLITK